ncbi:uncharacterized protein [Diadema setosum]|uniref:uncharacterized protein isoform X2 n=1 Tax=Diadema setosum TaxID=31175 RepID=UPI003B3B9CB1
MLGEFREDGTDTGAPSVWELLLKKVGQNSIAAMFMSESKAVSERLLAHNASDKGAVSIQVQAAIEESKSQFTGFVPGDEDSRQRISTGVDVKIDTKDGSPGVTVQSSVDYPTNPPGTSVRDGSGAMDDDDSDDNGYALWDQDLQNEEEETLQENATPEENADGLARTDGGLECQSCHTKFRHTWDFDIHSLQCPAQSSVYACYKCDLVSKQKFRLVTHLRKMHNIPLAEIQAKIQNVKIPKSDIVIMKGKIRKKSMASHRDQKKSYACDRCDFTYNGQEPIIKHLQEEHKLTLAETLSKYQELEVPVSKLETGKRRSQRLLKLRRVTRSGKKKKGDKKKTKKRRTSRSSRNCGRNSPSSTSQPEECGGNGIVMNLGWNDTLQGHESATDEEDNCTRVLPEKINLRTLCIELQDIRKSKEVNSQEVKSEVDPVEHATEITFSTTEHSEMYKEMETNPEETVDRNQTQAGEEAVTKTSPTETSEGVSSSSSEGTDDKKQTQAREEAVTEISPTETSEGVSSSSSKSTQSHSRKSQKQCDICGEHFKSRHFLQKHIRSEHFGVAYVCSTCNKVYDTLLSFRLHIKMHKSKANNTVFQCEICLKTFSHVSSYNSHKYLHGDKYACEVCGRTFGSKRSLDAHVNREHTKDKLFPCIHCDKVYYCKRTLRQHMQIHSERQCECDICHKRFHFAYQVDSHKRTVHTGRSHLCETCGSSFKSEGTLKQHHDTVHSAEFRYKCDVCGRRFKRVSHLNFHKRTHTDIKPYPCEICGKNFRTATNLKVHTNWHNNVRDFVCDACGKAFLTKANLDKHYFTHTGRKPHPCTECEHDYVDLPSLRHHLLKKHGIHLERKAPRKLSSVTKAESLQTEDPTSTKQQPQINSASSPPGMPSTPRTVVESVRSSVVSGQPAQFDVVSSAVTASGISEDGLKTAEQVSEDLQPPAMTASSLPQHSTNVDDNMIATEALMQIIMSEHTA